MTSTAMEVLEAAGSVGSVITILLLLFLVYFVFVKSALVRLWWVPLSPVLHWLGLRCVVMDMSFGIHSIKWKREWVGGE